MTDDAYIGEIRMFAFGQVPTDWLPCNGQTIKLTQEYAALAKVLGGTYGQTDTTFNLPNLQCCAPIGAGWETPLSATPYGSATVALTADQLPTHSHALQVVVPTAEKPGKQTGKPSTSAMLLGGQASLQPFSATGPQTGSAWAETTNAGAIPADGHPNVHPSFAVQFCICHSGMFPAS